MICVFSIEYSSKISCCVYWASVFLGYDTWSHIVIWEINDHSTFALLQKTGSLNLVHNSLALVSIETLSKIVVEIHSEEVVCSLVFNKTYILEPLPYAECFLVSIFHLVEPCSCLVNKLWILVSLFMELHIQLHELWDSILLNSFLWTPCLVSYDKLTKLCAPIAKVIYSYNIVSKLGMNLVKRVTDYCSSEMANVEILCNVRRWVVNTYGLSLAYIGFAEVICVGCLYHCLYKYIFLDIEVQVCTCYIDLLDEIYISYGFLYIGCNHIWGFSEHLCQPEARKCKITHIRAWWDLDWSHDIWHFDSFYVIWDKLCNFFFHDNVPFMFILFEIYMCW